MLILQRVQQTVTPSLAELNYYNYTKTYYDVTFPSGHKGKHHYKNLLSMSYSFLQVVSCRTSVLYLEVSVDEKGLSLMVALNLFAEAAGDTDGHKKEIRTDWVRALEQVMVN